MFTPSITSALNALRLRQRSSCSTTRVKQDPGIAEARTKVAEYVTKFAQPESSPCVTLVNFRDGAVILDGNKTCMAAFIHARQVRDYSLPVYRLEDLTRTIRQAIG